MTIPIKTGICTEGTNLLKYHALRDDGSAACSSRLPVSTDHTLTAKEVPADLRCQAKACQKLYKLADSQY